MLPIIIMSKLGKFKISCKKYSKNCTQIMSIILKDYIDDLSEVHTFCEIKFIFLCKLLHKTVVTDRIAG